MKILKLLAQFLLNGVAVFREASRGEYKRESKEVSEFRDDLFSKEKQLDDKTKLIQDRNAIEKDVQNAWSKIVLNNG